METELIHTSLDRMVPVAAKRNGSEEKFKAILEGIGDGYYANWFW